MKPCSTVSIGQQKNFKNLKIPICQQMMVWSKNYLTLLSFYMQFWTPLPLFNPFLPLCIRHIPSFSSSLFPITENPPCLPLMSPVSLSLWYLSREFCFIFSSFCQGIIGENLFSPTKYKFYS
jgi:hypothetical protein